MTSNRASGGIAAMLQTLCVHNAANHTDGQLLAQFLAQHDEAAFTALLSRHGPMVLGVCCRVLGNTADAEDAFQAVFLVLVEKAAALAARAELGDWLHGVARYTALNARRARARRRDKEQARAQGPLRAERNDWLLSLDTQISRLPLKYRVPVVLCDLEGKTRREASKLLGWPEGTVATRLARGRALLAKRLMQSAQVLSGALTGVLVGRPAQAALPPALACATAQVATWVASGKQSAQGTASAAVLLLARGVVRSMLLTKLKYAAGTLLVLALCSFGFGVFGIDPKPNVPAEAKHIEEQKALPAQEKPGGLRKDLFGDALPPYALARMGTVRFAQGDSMQEYPVLAPDHQTFATVSSQAPLGRVVCLWDAKTGKELRQIYDPDFDYYHVFFLHSQDLLGTVGVSRKPVEGQTHAYVLHFWDPRTGKKTSQQIQTKSYDFEPCALAPNEKWLATASRDPPVVVRDLKTGKSLAVWEGNAKRVNQLAFSPDGNTIAIACDSALCFWDWQNNRETHRVEVASVQRLWYSPNGKWFAASVYKEGLRVWETARFTELPRFKDQFAGTYPHDVRFLPDGDKLISTSSGVIWDVASGKEHGRLENCQHCLTLEFSRDKKTATGYAFGRIHRWNVATGKDITPPYPPDTDLMFHQLGFLPDGKTVVSASPDGAVRLWDALTGKPLRTLAAGTIWDIKQVCFMRVAVDGTIIVVRNKRLTFFKNEDMLGEIELAGFPSDTLASVNIAANGKTLVLAGSSDTKRLVQLWDVASRKLLSSFEPLEGTCLETLGISSTTGKITACVGDSICLLNPQTGKIERTLDKLPAKPLGNKHGGRSDDGGGYDYFHGIQALGFSPAGDLVVSAGHPAGGLKLLDVFTGKTRQVLVEPRLAKHYHLRNAVFSPDGAMLAAESQGDVLEIWETISGKLRHRFVGHRSYQTTLAFSPDGCKLATGNRDKTILVWDVFGLFTPAGANEQPPAPTTLAAWWDALKDASAQRAGLAMGWLMRHPDVGVPFLKQRLLARQYPEAAQQKQWLADLDSVQFSKREVATKELSKKLASVYPLLKEALAANPSLEKRQRVEALILKVEMEPISEDNLRDLRAMEVLEHIGSKAARQVIGAIAEGNYHPCLAAAARAAGTRLGGTP
jgi:RNA polymerase sigma factor (sigma-70 family)